MWFSGRGLTNWQMIDSCAEHRLVFVYINFDQFSSVLWLLWSNSSRRGDLTDSSGKSFIITDMMCETETRRFHYNLQMYLYYGYGHNCVHHVMLCCVVLCHRNMHSVYLVFFTVYGSHWPLPLCQIFTSHTLYTRARAHTHTRTRALIPKKHILGLWILCFA